MDEQPQQRRSQYVRASRCGECHMTLLREWQESAHGRATLSRAYGKATAGLRQDLLGLCEDCHLPSQPYGQPRSEPGHPADGVSCDGCHTLHSVDVGPEQAAMTYDPGSGVRYGPLKDANGHYFHDMAYSELHTRADVCAGCHHRTAFTFAGETRNIPVVTDFAGWKTYGRGKPCQECHMPSHSTAIAVASGARPRPEVPGHSFLGAAALGKTLRMEPELDWRAGTLRVEIGHQAGHPVPSGFVDRRLILRVSFLTSQGIAVMVQDRSHGIFLVDAQGQPAPFFRAQRVLRDDRLLPGRTYTEVFAIPAALRQRHGSSRSLPARVSLELLAAPTAPELSETYGPPETQVLRGAVYTLTPRGTDDAVLRRTRAQGG